MTMASSCQGIPDSELCLRHPIFISHSGEDKNFVRFLYRELVRRSLDPFFDEESLPKGEVVTMQNILIEARSSKLALFVLTPAFFTRTINPMMELIACVESNVQLFPLFYKLTVDEVKQSRDNFRGKWIELNAKANNHCLDLDVWSNAFKKLTSVNGLEFGKKSTSEADFVEEVADIVYIILPPINPRGDTQGTHIVGKARLVQIVEHMFDESPNVECGVKVLGLYGMEGMGKTTLCDALCNFYLTGFEGRVCHVELSKELSQDDLVRSILKQLGLRQRDAYSNMSLIEASMHLERTLSSSKFFLVLDDIQDSQSDKDEIGRLLLNRIKHIPMGSKLLFLARRSSVLWNVLSPLPGGSDSHIHPFPGLNSNEAKLILGKEFPLLSPDNGMNEPKQNIDHLNQYCIELCKPTSGSDFYNPLMVKLLASFLIKKWNSIKERALQRRSNGMPQLIALERHLTDLKGNRSWGMKEFFDKLHTSFNSLIEDCQELFLDLALFAPGKDVISKHLCLRRDKKSVYKILENLRDASFLSDDYGMYDVHRELAKMIARKSTSALHYSEDREFKGADLLHVVNSNWTRVAFVNCTFRMVKAHLDLSRCDNIQVLLLDRNKGLKSVILASNGLQSIEIQSATEPGLVHSVAMQEINEASSVCNRSFPFSYFTCLAIFELGGIAGASFWSFDAAQLSHCNSLEILQLYNIKLQTDTWALPHWPYLRELKLSQLPNLENLSRLEHLSSLRKLHLSELNALISLSNVQFLGKLTAFALCKCERVSELRLPGSLQHCSIEKCDTLRIIDVVCDREEDASKAEEMYQFSDEEWIERSENRIIIKECGNLQQIRGQPSSFQDFNRPAASLGESFRISYIEFHKSPGTWLLHGLAVEQVERDSYVEELWKLLGDAVELKTLKVVCAKSGFCGCGANPPSFHLLPSLECLEYHCSHVTDLSNIGQCMRLRSLHLDGCRNVATPHDFSELLSLSEYSAPVLAIQLD